MRYEGSRVEQAKSQTETCALEKDCENAKKMNDYLLETQRNLMRQNESEGARGHDLKGDQSQK